MKAIEFSELYIFTKHAGKDGQGTLKFINGVFFPDHVGLFLCFSYTSASTGATRHARFKIKNIAGFSYTEKEKT